MEILGGEFFETFFTLLHNLNYIMGHKNAIFIIVLLTVERISSYFTENSKQPCKPKPKRTRKVNLKQENCTLPI